MIDIQSITIASALKSLEKGEYTSADLVGAYLEQIKKINPDINAYLEVFDDAMGQAKKADESRASLKTAGKDASKDDSDASSLGSLSLLGIPFAIKDNILIQGRQASASSKILEQYVAPYDATAIAQLKAAGAVFIGRVNMDEFAMGGSTENSAYGVTKNPHDLERVSGGSSGGSAAAVAMNGALVALGSDTGGSIRQPASYCGAVGLKPTYGRVSRHGLMAMGSSLDVIGPITKTVEDSEIVYNAIRCADSDRYDSTTLTKKEVGDVSASHKSGIERGGALRIGIVPELMNLDGLSSEVRENLNQTIEKFKDAGYEIKEISLPNIKYSLAVYYILMPAEVSSNMARFDAVKYGSKVAGADLLEDYLNTRGELLGKEVRKRIMLGTYVLSSGYHDAYYNKANLAKDLIALDFKKAFEDVDVILTPTAPTPAFKIGAHTSDPVAMYLEDIFTVTANLIGIPAISVPSGFAGNLPIGMQFMAPHCREDILFAIGKKLEEIR